MAQYTVYKAAPPNLTSTQFFQTGSGGTLLGWTDTSVNIQNPDGTIVAITGTGFDLEDNLSGDTVPIAGTGNTIVLYASDFATQLASFSGLSVSAVDFYNTWQVSKGNVFAFLLPGDDTITGSDNDDNLLGFAGADTINGGLGNDYIEPGKGADTVDGGGGRDMLSYANAIGDITVTKGITVDLTLPTVTDPWGSTDGFTGIEAVRSTNFGDTLVGDGADNRFEPLGGADNVDGGAGQDQIRYIRDAQYGALLGVTVNLALGTATDGFGKADTFSNIEAVVGTDQADTLIGGDTPLANSNSYEIYGQGGDDTIKAGSHDLYVEPGAGSDSITGGAGSDQVSYAEYTGSKGATFDLATAKVTDPYGGIDTLFGSIEGVRGTRNADTIIGNGLNNFFRGLAGNDSINGGTGTDQVRYDRDAQYGGTLGVTVDLGSGGLGKGTATDGFGTTDTLTSIENARGSAQADTLKGDDGGNSFQGLAGADTIDGSGGFDTADYGADAAFGGLAGVTVNLALGTATDGFGATDTLISIEQARGTAFADNLTGGNAPLSGTDIYQLVGADGDDTLTAGSYDTLLQPGAGDDTATGGAGTDQISYEEYTGDAGAVINLATGVVADPYGGTDKISSIEAVRGTRNADTITGNAGNNFFRGLAGADTIDGGGGTDQVRYDRDALGGGNGNIAVDLQAGKATDGFGFTDTLISIENVRGSNNNDDLRGDDNNNAFQPMSGADLINGRGGQDTVDYSAETLAPGITGVTVSLIANTAAGGDGLTDTLISIEAVRGTAGADTLTGGNVPLVGQSYNLFGMAGDDTIAAGSFNTYIEPGAGDDTITGGAGFDEISYAEYSGSNPVFPDLLSGHITDPYGGTDTVLGGIEALRGTRNDDHFVGNAENNRFRGLGGSDIFNGYTGVDRVRYDLDAQYGGSKGVTVNLALGTATDGFGATDSLIAIEEVEGTAFADTLTGGDANLGPGVSWQLLGRGGDDVLIGGASSVYIEPGAGNDTVKGGAGTGDQISYADFTNGIGITLDLGKGSVVDPLGGIDGFTGIENVRGTAFADSILGDAGSNQLTGLKGADKLDGAGGTDFVRYDRDALYGGTAGAKVDLALGTATDGFGTIDTLLNIENARGSNAADQLFGDGNANMFQGLGGADTIDGRGGVDTVDYSRDIAELGAGGVTVNLGSVGLGNGTATDGFGATDTLLGIENVVGTGVADSITGDGADNVLQGNQGDDTIDGGDGADTAVFAGLRAGYTIVQAPDGSLAVTGADGKDTVRNVEVLRFNDASLAVGPTSFAIATVTGSLAEGTGAGSTNFTFKVSRSGGVALPQSIGWSVTGATGPGTAPADALDFTGGKFPTGTLSFAAGETFKTITVPVGRDITGELNERFAVTLGAPPVLAGIATGTAQAVIINDDTSYQIISKAAAVAEGNGANSTHSFVIQRTGNTITPGTVDYTLTSVGGTPATSADFPGGPVLPLGGTLSFAAGQSSATLTVPVQADATPEANETFRVTLLNPVGGVIAIPSATQTILNDDTVFNIAATSASKAEGTGAPGATTPFTFTVTRGGTPGVAQSVAWSVAGTAGPGTQPADAADFAGGVLPAGILTFAAGETSKVVSVNVAADAVGELAERFAVTLANPTGGAVLGASGSAQGVIQNDDTSLRVVASGAMTQTEGNIGPRPYTFVVQRQGTTTGISTVDYAVTGAGTNPANAADFTGGVLPADTLTFAAGETSKTITVNVAGDTAFEPDEGFRFALSNPTGAAISTATLGAVIQSDDSTLSIAAASANKPEGTGAAGATTQFTFTVTRTGATGVSQSVNFAVAGIAGAGTVPASALDFAGGVLPAGSVAFTAGQTSRTITINVAADQLAELNERFGVTLSNPTGGAQLGTAVAQGIIQTDDFASTAANETLNGTAANDLFLLGGGIDTVFGKGGVDSFRFLQGAIGNPTTRQTFIEDFNPAAGEKIDLSPIDAIAGTLANDAFTFNPIPGAPFAGAGSLRWEPLGAYTVITGDVNGDGLADLAIQVKPQGAAVAGWFNL